MTRRQVVPAALSRQVRQQLRRMLAVDGGHPRVGVRAGDAVQDVVVGRASRDRGAIRRELGHRRQRTRLVRVTAALALFAAMVLPGALPRRPRPPRTTR